jgi:GlpG protein
MIEIGRLPNQRTAQAFIDYLKGLGIDCDAQVDELDIRLVSAPGVCFISTRAL